MKTHIFAFSILLFLPTSPAHAHSACPELTVGAKKIEIEAVTDAIAIHADDEVKRLLPPNGGVHECLELKAIDGHPEAASVEFWTEESGTKSMKQERDFGVFDLESAKWIVEPFALQKRVRTMKSQELEEVSSIERRKDLNGKTEIWRLIEDQKAKRVFPK